MMRTNQHGALLIDKPPGPSSFDVIRRLQALLQEASGCARRELPAMGHGGTLDPFASGLLVVCLGEATKLTRYGLASRKAYELVIRFGAKTDSGDLTTGVIAEVAQVPQDIGAIMAAAQALTSETYWQIPPMYSAKKSQGRPLYELARRGEVVAREPVACSIYSIDVRHYAPPEALVRVECSAGTYMRTLAEDLAVRLGSLAHLVALRRRGAGNFEVSAAWDLEQIAAATAARTQWSDLPCWRSIADLVATMARSELGADQVQALRCGQQALLQDLLGAVPAGEATTAPVALFHAQDLVAIARADEQGWHLERVFGNLSDK